MNIKSLKSLPNLNNSSLNLIQVMYTIVLKERLIQNIRLHENCLDGFGLIYYNKLNQSGEVVIFSIKFKFK